MGYHSKAVSGTRTMAVSLGRSDVLAEQDCDLAESQGSRDVSGSVFAPKPTYVFLAHLNVSDYA